MKLGAASRVCVLCRGLWV